MPAPAGLWDWLKAENRYLGNRRRGVRAPAERRQKVSCTCPHTPKHHKKTGRCRRGCDCAAGANR